MSILKQLYYTLVYSYVTYGLMSWGTAYQTELNESKSVKTTVFALYIFWIPHAKISCIPESVFTLNGGSILVCCSNEPDTCQQNLVKGPSFQHRSIRKDQRGWKRLEADSATGKSQRKQAA